MNVMKHLARSASKSTIGKCMDNIRVGWTNYSFLFYIGGVSAILGSLFGLAGWASSIVTLLFFYYAGEFKKHVLKESKSFGIKE
jgi:hypothetical protein